MKSEPMLYPALIRRNRHLIFWATLLGAAALVFWLAPEEQTLGQGIKSVYLHVSLIWVGMVGVALAGLIGLGILFTASNRLLSWMGSIGWVALTFYGAGVGMSMVASKVNWGHVFWQEPRMRSALNLLALMLVVQLISAWIPWARLRGLLSAGLLLAFVRSTLGASLVLHPSDPIRSSSSVAIKLSFLGLFILCALAGIWFVWHWRPGSRSPDRRTQGFTL